MVHYKFNQAEIRNLWKHCRNKRYDIKSFKNQGCYVKYIIFDDKQNGGCATGKVVTRFTEGEVYHWPRLRHRSLAPLLDVIYIDERIAVYMSSYLPQTLRELIHDENFINDSQCFDRKKSFIEDVLRGLSYLHSKHLSLMNISDVNVFVTQAENRAVIANFTCLSMFHNAYKHKRCAPLMYRAPELTTSTTYSVLDPIPTDIWSVGVMVMEVFLNHMCPWGSVDYDSNRALDLSTKIDYEMLKIANRGSILTSNDVLNLKKFLGLFLDLNPKNRCSAKEAASKRFIQSTTYRIHIRKKNIAKSEYSFESEKLALHSGDMNSYSPCQLKNQRSLSEIDLYQKSYQSNLHIFLPETKPNHKNLSVKKNYFERHINKPSSEITNLNFKSLDLKKFTELANTSELGKNTKGNREYYKKSESAYEISTRDQIFFPLSNPKSRPPLDLEHPIESNKTNLGMNKYSEKFENNSCKTRNEHSQNTYALTELKSISKTDSKENIYLRESFSDSKLMPTTKILPPNVFNTIQMSAPSYCYFPSTKNRKFSKINNTKNNHRPQLESSELPNKKKSVPHATGSTKSAPKENTSAISIVPDKTNNISSFNRNNDKAINTLRDGYMNKNFYSEELDTNKMVNTNDTWNTNAWRNNIVTSVKMSTNHKKNNHWNQFNKTLIPDTNIQEKVVLYTTGSSKNATKEIPNLNVSPFSDIINKETNFARKSATELSVLNTKNVKINFNSQDQDKQINETISTIETSSTSAQLLKPKPSPRSSYKEDIKILNDLVNAEHPRSYETSSLTVHDFRRNGNRKNAKSSNKVVAGKSPADSVSSYVEDFVDKSPARQLKVVRHKTKRSHNRRRHINSRKSAKRNVSAFMNDRDKLSSKQKCQMSKFLLNNLNEDLNEEKFENDFVDSSNGNAILKSLKQKPTKSDASRVTHKGRKLKKFLCFG